MSDTFLASIHVNGRTNRCEKALKLTEYILKLDPKVLVLIWNNNKSDGEAKTKTASQISIYQTL